MKLFPDTRTFISIFGLDITWYAILILTGALTAYWITQRNFKKRGYDLEMLDDLFFGALFSGVIGARLWYVLFFDLNAYLTNPMRILDFREGGLAIHGGVFLGVLYGYIFMKRRGYTFLRHADEAVYNILIAQAIGRWGNFMNQEAFGGVVSESFFDGWPAFIKNQMFIAGEYRQPTFLFESVLNIIGWLVIHFFLRKTKDRKEGDLVWAYLMWYGVVRFFIEALRTDALMLGDLKVAQLTSIAMIVVGLLGFFGVFRKIFKPKKPIIIVDFDGTIADTRDLIASTFVEVLNDEGITITDTDIDDMVGPPLEETFQKYAPDIDVSVMVERYRAHNRQLHPEMFKLMDGAREVLEELKAQGYILAVASNKRYEMVQYGLQLGDLNIFDIVVGSDMVEEAKPNPEMIYKITNDLKVTKDNMIYIGDTDIDMKTGKAANAYTIGFHKNPENLKQLENQQPNRLMNSWSELLDILKEERLWIYNTKS